jgi:hypothetical protein
MLPLSPQHPGAKPPLAPKGPAQAGSLWATRIAVAALVVIALAVAAYAGRTWLVAQAIKAQLATLGISDVSLTVSDMDKDGLVIDRLAAEHGAIAVSRIKVTYTLPDLRSGRVDALTFSGLSLVLNADERSIRIGDEKVSDLFRRLTHGGGSRLPYDELRVEGGALVVTTPTSILRGNLDLRLAEFNGAWETTIGLFLRGRDATLSLQGGGHLNLQAPAKSSGDGAFEVSLNQVNLPSFAQGLTVHARGAILAKDGAVIISTSRPADASIVGLAQGLRAKFPEAVAPLLAGTTSMNARAIKWDQRLDVDNTILTATGLDIQVGQDSLTGIQTNIDFALHPFKIESPHRVTVEAATIGAVKLANVDAQVTAAPGNVGISRAGADFAGGRIAIEDVSLPNLGDFAVEASKLDAAQLLALAKVQDLSVSGTISGRVPLHVDHGVARLDRAVLAADGKGVIAFQPKDRAGFGGAEGALTLKALSNLHYETLAIALSGATSDDIAANVTATGRTPGVYRGNPVALTVNLTGKFADLIANTPGAWHVTEAAVQQIKRAPKAPVNAGKKK